MCVVDFPPYLGTEELNGNIDKFMSLSYTKRAVLQGNTIYILSTEKGHAMRRAKWFVVVMTVFACGIFASNASADAGVLGGTVILGTIHGHNGQVFASDGNVIYAVPDMHSKVKDPLKLRFASTFVCIGSSTPEGKSLEEILDQNIKGWREHEILEIVRVFHPKDPECAAFWISFLTK